jgi:hypothetical protein
VFILFSPDGQPMSKKALKKLQKDAEKAAKKAEHKAAKQQSQPVKIYTLGALLCNSIQRGLELSNK